MACCRWRDVAGRGASAPCHYHWRSELYRYFGAGEEVGRMAAEGRWRPAIITGLVAIGLALCGLYALSGAGLVPSLPLRDIVLCVVAGAYTLRGLAYPVLKVMNSEASTPFFLWSSIICLIVGVVHLIGLAQIRGVI